MVLNALQMSLFQGGGKIANLFHKFCKGKTEKTLPEFFLS